MMLREYRYWDQNDLKSSRAKLASTLVKCGLYVSFCHRFYARAQNPEMKKVSRIFRRQKLLLRFFFPNRFKYSPVSASSDKILVKFIKFEIEMQKCRQILPSKSNLLKRFREKRDQVVSTVWILALTRD